MHVEFGKPFATGIKIAVPFKAESDLLSGVLRKRRNAVVSEDFCWVFSACRFVGIYISSYKEIQ